MFEVVSVDGIPTGAGSYDETTAWEQAAEMKRKYPNDSFTVEFVPAQDAWNGY